MAISAFLAFDQKALMPYVSEEQYSFIMVKP